MNANNGEILAIANYPSFNPNKVKILINNTEDSLLSQIPSSQDQFLKFLP